MVVVVTGTPAGTALAVAVTVTVVDRPVMMFEKGNRLVAEVLDEAPAQPCVPDQKIGSVTAHIGDIESRRGSVQKPAGMRDRPQL